MKNLRLSLTALASAVLLSNPAIAMDNVVASIKPVHSLVSAIMGNTGTPDLLVPGAASPHTYALRPSDAGKLQRAKIVFWVGQGIETFLEKPLEALATNAKIVTLSQAPGLTLLDLREGGAFDEHDHDATHEEENHDHDHAHHDDAKDMHIWLDPENARVIAHQIAAILSEADPANASIYAQNAASLDQRLTTLIEATSISLTSVKGKPFIVFHDAYHYFENRFSIAAAGSISVNPETPPSAHRVKEIKEKIAETHASCVFAEPQFEPRIIKTVIEGSTAQSGELDPIGANIQDGPDLYFQLISDLASSLKNCLSQ